MSAVILLPLKEANLLRLRLQKLMKEHQKFLQESDSDSVHDLRVASRRLREVLGYLQPVMPQKWQDRLTQGAKRITRTLGPLREAETNLKIVRQWLKENSLDPLAGELLIHSQQDKLRDNRLKAVKKLSGKLVPQYGTAFQKIQGSRSMPLTPSDIPARRSSEFLGFVWQNGMADEQLHDLRIRAKKFRYAVEIDARLHSRKLGRLIGRIKRLQDKLGEFHDLYVLGELIRVEMEKYQADDVTLIPAALGSAHERVLKENNRIYPLLYPLYSRVVTALPPELYSFAGQQPAIAG